MKVKTVIETHNVDGYYSAQLFSVETSDEAIAQYYADAYGFNVNDFEDKYEISSETVTSLTKD